MRPTAIILDDFLLDFEAVRTYFDTAKFQQDTENAADGLIYPTTIDFQDDKFGIETQLGKVFGCRIGLQAIIARLSLAEVHPPYAVHSDAFMGSLYTCIIYLTRDEHILPHRGAGTVLCRRWDSKAENYTGLPQELEDANLDGKWETVVHCEMKANRAFIFPSHKLHYSSPFWGGFGTDQKNGRLVLAVLFTPMGLMT